MKRMAMNHLIWLKSARGLMVYYSVERHLLLLLYYTISLRASEIKIFFRW